MAKPQIHVAIALLMHQAQVLVGYRQAEQHQGNLYEFPGGKCETHETALDCCRREVFEEVGIDVSNWRSLGQSFFAYNDIDLTLHWFQTHLTSAASTQINLTQWQWYSREALRKLAFPKANRAILSRLQWPRQLKISANIDELSQYLALDLSASNGLIESQSLASSPATCQIATEPLVSNQHASNHLKTAAVVHPKLGYFRPAQDCSLAQCIQALNKLQPSQREQIMLNFALWQQLPEALQAQFCTVHLKHNQLMALNPSQMQPQLRYVAACHDAASVQRAQDLVCDAILLSPVRSTLTHPQAQVLGWSGFAKLAAQSQVPVYALGGLSPNDLALAQQHGAYGVAGIRAF